MFAKNFGAFLFLFVISTFDSAGDIWKHNKNKNLTNKKKQEANQPSNNKYGGSACCSVYKKKVRKERERGIP